MTNIVALDVDMQSGSVFWAAAAAAADTRLNQTFKGSPLSNPRDRRTQTQGREQPRVERVHGILANTVHSVATVKVGRNAIFEGRH